MASHTAEDGDSKVVKFQEHFEICSLVGTLVLSGAHLHIALGREDGSTVSGHVVGDLTVFTTAEVVIGECVDVVFSRKYDDRTGFNELNIAPRSENLIV